MHPSIVCVGASRVVNLLSTPCKRLLSPFCRLNRQPHYRIQGGPEFAAALPRLPRFARRSTSEGDGGFCHGVPGEFSTSRRSRPDRQAKEWGWGDITTSAGGSLKMFSVGSWISRYCASLPRPPAAAVMYAEHDECRPVERNMIAHTTALGSLQCVLRTRVKY
jgi:hypothetical protein